MFAIGSCLFVLGGCGLFKGDGADFIVERDFEARIEIWVENDSMRYEYYKSRTISDEQVREWILKEIIPEE